MYEIPQLLCHMPQYAIRNKKCCSLAPDFIIRVSPRTRPEKKQDLHIYDGPTNEVVME